MDIENIFCQKCHKLAAEIRKNEEKIELRQNGRVLLALSSKSSGNSISVKCPSGHSVKVEI